MIWTEQSGGRLRRGIAFGLMFLGVGAWLWPIGVGGRMPVSGDATQFSIGLFAELGRAIRAGRLPVWNDLWGFGFPGLAESQMGVYYPPHALLYGLLPTEVAFVANLILHTIGAAVGAAWAAGKLGASAPGAALAGFTFAASGFFAAHLPHPWAVTTGSWMPWAWGLAWDLVRGRSARRGALLLAACLSIQCLPGHFQLAFETQVGVLGLVAWSFAFRPDGPSRAARGAAWVAVALAMTAPLAALQLWPTARLAASATGQRDYEYLSGFAVPPSHLMSYLAPGLFRSALWRPLVWDPFHTSPEEHFGTVGLIPLFLALAMVATGWRRDRTTQGLVVLLVGSIALSLGPYLPGFSWLIRLPGFSFFRAPARWGLATALALSLLAGLGFDRLPGVLRPGRWLVRYAGLTAGLVTVAVLMAELAFAADRGRAPDAVGRAFEGAFRALPWSGDPGFRAVMLRSRAQQGDLRERSAMARAGFAAPASGGWRLEQERGRLYVRELRGTAILLAGVVALALAAPRGSRPLAVGLVALTALDLIVLHRDRPIDTGPVRPLAEQSPVLARLAREPRGTRVLGRLQNLPMAVAAATLPAYRTLDLPTVPRLLAEALTPDAGRASEEAAARLRALGVGVRISGPFEAPPGRVAASARREILVDPTLAGWLFGADLVAQLGPAAARFSLAPAETPPALAWLIDSAGGMSSAIGDDPALVARTFREARPLPHIAPVPERFEVEVMTTGPAAVVITQLDDPEWVGQWEGPGGRRPAMIGRAFGNDRGGGWQVVPVPEPGRWTLRLHYEGRAARQGLAVSAIAWATWAFAFGWPRRRADRSDKMRGAPGESRPAAGGGSA